LVHANACDAPGQGIQRKHLITGQKKKWTPTFINFLFTYLTKYIE
jgi:hypothetical protein